MSTVNFDLGGKVAVLLGGGGILGSRMAAALAEHHASVAVVDRDGDKARKVVASLPAGSRACAYAADVTQPQSLRNLHQQIRTELGDVDVLVNNAVTKSKDFFAPFEEFPLADWDEVVQVNLTGAMLACQIFGGAMRARGRGSIINTLSIYGIVGPDQRIYEGAVYEGRAINTPAVYSASKAGLLGLTKYLAAYWGPHGIRVNAVTPGGVFSGQNETFQKHYGSRLPLGRMAQGHEICGAVVYLASDASSYVTGHNLVVDGGWTAW